jgi:glycosyltransferase involved in cell wall biosynthesis
MYKNKKVVVVMPAYNAEQTLLKTYNEVIEQNYVDTVIIVDDASNDRTVALAKKLKKTQVFVNKKNMGYGANQKICYREALKSGADIIIMVHPDYQYTPKLIPAMVSILGNDLYQCVLGSRILGGYALRGGMPIWKYISNRFLTAVENFLTGGKLSEYHTGYRGFTKELLETLNLSCNSNDFIFDNQMLAQILWKKKIIAEITCPTKYFEEASSINFYRSVKYGIGCILTGFEFRLNRMKLMKSARFTS